MRRLVIPALLTLFEWSLLVTLVHELLRQFMNARGVMPWRLADTAGNAFFLLFGFMLATLGANVLLLAWNAADRGGARVHVAGVALLVVGALMAYGGALSLRKLY